MKTLRMRLSTNDINHMIKRLEKFKKRLGGVDEEIVKELSELGLKEIETNYAMTPYKDGNDDISFFSVGSEKEKTIGVVGSQVLYNEFGTGTEGERNPHPEKGEFGLNPYNSGRTIRRNERQNSIASKQGIPEGELYWTYIVDGKKQYTQGIPAGKQVYMAKQTLDKQKEKISKKVIGDALSKL